MTQIYVDASFYAKKRRGRIAVVTEEGFPLLIKDITEVDNIHYLEKIAVEQGLKYAKKYNYGPVFTDDMNMLKKFQGRNMAWIPTEDNKADRFTKFFDPMSFKRIYQTGELL